MKNLVLIVLAIAALASNSFARSPKKIYPQILAYFKTLDKEQERASNLSALETLRHNFNLSDNDSVVLVCSGSSFRSQALQVFLETKLAEKKMDKVQIYSCGYKTMEIDERLIDYLKEIGYRVTVKQVNGKQAYQVKYSDVFEPIILYPKTCIDKTLPKKPIISILACQEAPGSCERLTDSNIKINLSYKDRS